MEPSTRIDGQEEVRPYELRHRAVASMEPSTRVDGQTTRWGVLELTEIASNSNGILFRFDTGRNKWGAGGYLAIVPLSTGPRK